MSTPWIVLGKAVCFRVSGKDSRRYLHNRLSQDIRSLESGHSTLGAALSAQGRVEGLFSVHCEEPDRFLVVCDGGDAETLESALKRFVVADRVTFEDISRDVTVVHIAVTEVEARAFAVSAGLQPVGSVRRGRIAAVGADLLLGMGDQESVARALRSAKGDELTSERYDLLRWRAGCPVFPREINDRGMVLEYNLREAVSFTKGCYVGQEVVERSDAVGKVPRRLERITLDGSGVVGLGGNVCTVGGEALGTVVGEVTSPADEATFLFALLRTGKYKEGDEVVCDNRRGVIAKAPWVSAEGRES